MSASEKIANFFENSTPNNPNSKYNLIYSRYQECMASKTVSKLEKEKFQLEILILIQKINQNNLKKIQTTQNFSVQRQATIDTLNNFEFLLKNKVLDRNEQEKKEFHDKIEVFKKVFQSWIYETSWKIMKLGNSLTMKNYNPTEAIKKIYAFYEDSQTDMKYIQEKSKVKIEEKEDQIYKNKFIDDFLNIEEEISKIKSIEDLFEERLNLIFKGIREKDPNIAEKIILKIKKEISFEKKAKAIELCKKFLHSKKEVVNTSNLHRKNNISFISKITESLKKCDHLSSSKIINGDLLFDCLLRVPKISENNSNFINTMPPFQKITTKLFEKNFFALINEVPNEFLSETMRREKTRNIVELGRRFKRKIKRKENDKKESFENIENFIFIIKKWKEVSKSIISSMKEVFFTLLAKLKEIIKNWKELMERLQILYQYPY